jgi:hypothetical protein
MNYTLKTFHNCSWQQIANQGFIPVQTTHGPFRLFTNSTKYIDYFKMEIGAGALTEA